MSTRRQARAAALAGVVIASEVPAPLRSRNDPAWRDADAVADLARAHRVDYVEPPEDFDSAPLRFVVFRDAYLRARSVPAVAADLEALGIDATTPARARYAAGQAGIEVARIKP